MKAFSLSRYGLMPGGAVRIPLWMAFIVLLFTSFVNTGSGQWGSMNIASTGSAQLQNCEIRYAGASGSAALSTDSSNLQVKDCRIHHNASRGVYINGTGLTPTFDGMRVDHNGYGGLANYGGVVTLSNSTFDENTLSSCSSAGAGIRNDNGGTLTIVNSTFYSNTGCQGGNVYNAGGGTLTVTHSTLSDGYSWPSGPGGNVRNDGGTVTLKNTIMANPSAGGNCSGTITDGGGNLRWPKSDASCFGPFGDPKLGTLQDNGGSTWTMALGAGSAALESGSSSVCVTLTTDQRGMPRPNPAGSVCDVGAFESTIRSIKNIYRPVVSR